jgi:DNA-binding transcriptional regulator YdaS (Cro superfamily)
MSNKLTLSQMLALAVSRGIAPVGSVTLSPFEALQLAVDLAGGQSAMGRICKKAQPTVWKWLQTSKRLPPEHVLAVEDDTGVSRHLLRPDIYPLDMPPLPASAIAEPTPLCGPILPGPMVDRQGNAQRLLDKTVAGSRA